MHSNTPLVQFCEETTQGFGTEILEVTFLLSLLGSWKEITVYGVNLMSPWQEVVG